MTSFANSAHLQAFLQQDVEIGTATFLLDIASGVIRRHVGWSISEETVQLTTQGTGDNVIWLPTKFLTVITSVVEDGVTLIFGTHYRWTSTGRLRRLSGRWTCEEQSVVVTFTHGYDPVPDDVRGVCVSLAGRFYNNPDGLRQWTVGGISQTVAGSADGITGMLSDDEKAQLSQFEILSVA